MAELAALKEKLHSSDVRIEFMKIDEKLLRRYLIAHKTVDAAYERILATDAWRKEFEVASINRDTPGVKNSISLKVSVLLDQRDKQGRPVLYVAVRNHSFRNRDVDDMTQFIVYMLENACSKFHDDGLDNLCLLFDMKGFSLMCMDYPLLKILFSIMTDHYPERLGVALVLNAPYIFSACWAIIRTWLDENTARKINFIKGKEQLSAYIDPDFIPDDL